MSVINQEQPAATPDVVRAWVDGWAVSRSVRPPVEVAGGFRLEVGLPGHRVRYVLFDARRVAELAPTLTAPGTWLKVSAPAERVAPLLTPAWTVGEPEYLMSVPLCRATALAPDGYTLHTATDGQITTVRIHDADGTTAASGQTGVAGPAAVADKILTDPAHRRRGLGSVLMTALGDAAAERGATTGVLVATRDGLALYRALGWTLRETITPAYIPENG
ncbi:GNAT family N-acetyltransferase [Streptosporangium amethystogenes]|uniref:GNAT family N-acetyltransferase n=1 Tax=Streptosporangium amethystogenes TaxID=2002 RepID=UPI0006896F4E|nr:GNAT family N-acetyltransferase [Streptosporangium amethystogenes]